MDRFLNTEVLIQYDLLQLWLLDGLAERGLLSLKKRSMRRFPRYPQLREVFVQDRVVSLFPLRCRVDLRFSGLQYFVHPEEVLVSQLLHRSTCVDELQKLLEVNRPFAVHVNLIELTGDRLEIDALAIVCVLHVLFQIVQCDFLLLLSVQEIKQHHIDRQVFIDVARKVGFLRV